jgi:hypothetical protein
MLLTKLLLLPLVLHVLHTLSVGLRSLSARVRAVKNGSAKMHEIAVDSWAWPQRVRLLGNNFDSQFDTPMLWYAVCAFIVILKFEDLAFVAMSWAFLASRIWHTYIHTSSNYVPTRMKVFLFGFFTVVAMWIWFGAKLMVAGTL